MTVQHAWMEESTELVSREDNEKTLVRPFSYDETPAFVTQGAHKKLAAKLAGDKEAEEGALTWRATANRGEPAPAVPLTLPTLLPAGGMVGSTEATAGSRLRGLPQSETKGLDMMERKSSDKSASVSTGSTLPSLPEESCVAHKLSVLLVGQEARTIMQRITDKGHVEGSIASANSVASFNDIPTSPASGRLSRTSNSSTASADSPLEYFQVEEALSAVKFLPIESFADEFPNLQCIQDLREWLLVFLVDERQGLDSVLPDLHRRVQEVNFMLRSLGNKYKTDVRQHLHLVLLRHDSDDDSRLPSQADLSGASTTASSRSSSVSGADFDAFLTRLQEMTSPRTKQDVLDINFDDGEELHACVARKVREVLKQEEWRRAAPLQ